MFVGLTSATKVVLMVLAEHMKWRGPKVGTCYPGLDTIATESGLHRGAIHRQIDEAETQGYIEYERGRGKSNHYTATLPAEKPQDAATEKPQDAATERAEEAASSGRVAASSGQVAASSRSKKPQDAARTLNLNSPELEVEPPRSPDDELPPMGHDDQPPGQGGKPSAEDPTQKLRRHAARLRSEGKDDAFIHAEIARLVQQWGLSDNVVEEVG